MTLDPVWLTLGVALLCCVLGIVGVQLYASGARRHAALVARLDETGEPETTGRRRRHFRGIDRRVRRTNLGRKLELRIAATGLDITPGEFTVALTATVAVLWAVGQSALSPFFGPICGLLGVWVALGYLNWQRQKRIEKFINQLPELSRILANATQAGLALRMALSLAADEMESPAGDELVKVAQQLAVGTSLDDALGELAERLPSRELVVLVTTLVLANRAGGTVVSSLRNLTETLEERKETRREVRTQLSQVSMTAYSVPVIGVGSLLLIDNMQPGALDRMTGSTVGQFAVVAAFALYVVGFVAIRRFSKIDV
ncbi:type II secretion system F family protein [Streptomyces gardneri]|uniref:type II secretion system F family protein n=1 Tax=Streptomyces gardneri TaxID=66892 RepID=UPI0006BD988B|nr:type II secretion system F family protein [Streptomyces gardneri]QPK47732.1 type II secretion system F family protein [Streptomyces gardneri]WRK39180.1 type II secretion system F family protein [Streptomyces venezuelae]CUM38749.1 FIG00761799: membrane protein [Streptomyces venezuelae]